MWSGGGVNSVKAERVYASPSNGTQTWTAGTNTFTWNATGNNFINTGLPIGDITAYTNFHCTVSDFSENASFIRLVLKNGKDPQITEYINSGECNINLVSKYPDWDFTCVTDFLLFGSHFATDGHSIDGEHPASVVVTDIYLEKPNTLTFDATGKAVVNKTALTATGGLSYNPTTGVLTTDGTEGTLVLEFSEPVDLQYLNKLEISKSGDADIVDKIYFYEDDECAIENQSWSYSKWGGTTDGNATNKFTGKTIKKVVWKSAAGKPNTLTVTISNITWELKTISALKGVDITTLPFKNWSADGDNDAEVTGNINWWECASNFNKVTGDVIYGGQGIGDSKRYVDLTNYKKLIIRGYGTIRLFYNWQATPESKPIEYVVIEGSTVQTKEVDLDQLKQTNNVTHFHLVGVKGSGNCFVESISALDGTETSDYIISGLGYQLPSVTAALADATVTSIDATGLTNTSAIALESVNPNCLFKANAGKLSNTKNVIVDNVCANLELTDGYPYKAPVGFTATNAKFKKTVSDAGYATMMIPFGAALPTGVKAYNLTAVNGETITSSSVDAIAANSPVMIKADAATYDFKASNVSITATANGEVTNGLLNGTYATTTAAAGANNYVLQKNGNDVNFYLVTETAATVKPFRAYLKASGAGARALNLDLGETTGIETVKKADVTTAVYNLNGQRVAAPQKGLYIVNGKKVIVK